MEAIEIKLSAPIQAHGEEVTVLKIREPKGKDLVRHGIPFILEPGVGLDPSRIHFDARVIAMLLGECAGVPLHSIEQLRVGDFQAAQGVLLGFFGVDRPPTSGAASSSSPGSSAT